MNKHEKEIAKAQLSSEEKTLKELQQVFKKARQDVQEKISELNSRTDMQNLQSIIYQKKYQQAILDQINETLADLKSGQYKTVEDFLVESYDNGYIGMMYSLQSQGIPMTIPINDRNVVRALTTDSKLSSKYYQSNPLKGRLAENVDLLKQRVRSNLSRGIVAGKSWLDVAVDIASGMNNPFDIALRDAMRIVRTEGHRVHQQGFLDAGDKAKDKGADILKQWDATMDSKTRPAHQQADGQIVEWDDYFSVGGEKMKAPSVGGSAKNVCNCRCQLLQRARWALDESELETLQKRSEFFGLDKSESFEDFKQKYLKLPKNGDTIKVDTSSVLKTPIKDSQDANYNKLLGRLEASGVDYMPVESHTNMLSEEEIINALAGGDKTQGSCASVGLAYVGQKQGWNVLDFRDGMSRRTFSNSLNLYTLSLADGVKALHYGDVAGKASCTLAKNFLNTCEIGKEYYLCVGRHASIVRKIVEDVTNPDTGEFLKTVERLQYLELQSASRSGWTNFNENPRYTLTHRFGCSSTSGNGECYDFMMNITDSDFNTDEFRSLLGYINTAESEQRKGSNGTIK